MDVRLLAETALRCLAAYAIAVGATGLKSVRMILNGSNFELAYFVAIAVVPVVAGLAIFAFAKGVAALLFKSARTHPNESDVMLAIRALQVAGIFLIADCVPDLFSVVNYFQGLIEAPPGGTIPFSTAALGNAMLAGIGVRILVGTALLVRADQWVRT